MPTAMLLDHSNTFTPLNQIGGGGHQRRVSQEVENLVSKDDLDGYLDEDSNDNSLNGDPYSAEEILR